MNEPPSVQDKGSISYCCSQEVTAMLLMKPLGKQVLEPNTSLSSAAIVPRGSRALPWEAPTALARRRSLTQSSMCLDISGTSTPSFSAVTIKAGIRIWEGATGSRYSRRGKKCPFLYPS